ncbi:hypothetical protein ASPZODRAFT_2111114 [Penicilliopsis zonata CBS 506.65]|uniref:Heterokaryon incompatibility domain-containing protein n=1 Tax=Penicilliopsis zonata CBS 506.65 TaxID=1073090 RepID=A0A1L9SDD3_9EURO|nr:hypothetical protein ASPZODRAFT_2111114 [Penicilliopsis zonata CBS 506.65]OJJ45179.1 hypothetical protein ASPZODRAFT_2111114 [Penicilliopsis zonata CBS 506.65]
MATPRLEDWVKQEHENANRFVSMKDLFKVGIGGGRSEWNFVKSSLLEVETNKFVRKLAHLAAKVRDKVLTIERLQNTQKSPVPVIALSTLILCDTLHVIMQAHFDVSYFSLTGMSPVTIEYEMVFWQNKLPWKAFAQLENPQSNTFDDMAPSLRIIINRLLSHGWCPSVIDSAGSNLGYLTLYYMSDIQRPNPGGLDHKDCTRRVCKANQPPKVIIDKPQHISEGCACAGIRSMREHTKAVIAILEEGLIPLVQFRRTEDGKVDLKIVKATVETRYIAVSHVWSDGMGIGSESEIYECQLQNIIDGISQLPNHRGENMSHLSLNRTATRIPRTIPGIFTRRDPYCSFWLDVLCIPTKNAIRANGADPDAVRHTAIGQIAAVFAGAMQIMILDKEMQRLRPDITPIPEILALFYGSNWASRAWTYQEASQGARCNIKLLNGFLDPQDMVINERDWSSFIRRPDRWTLEDITAASDIDRFGREVMPAFIDRWICYDLQRLINEYWVFKPTRDTREGFQSDKTPD